VKNGSVADSSEDEVPESPATPRRKKISVGMPIHPPEGEITNLKVVNKRVEQVKGMSHCSKQEQYFNYIYLHPIKILFLLCHLNVLLCFHKAATVGRKTCHDPLTGSPSLDMLSEELSGGLSIQYVCVVLFYSLN